jgi:hypothetical protein
VQVIQQRTSPCLADLASQLSWLAADLALDVIEETDALDGLRSDRRAVGYVDVIELAPDMRPTAASWILPPS